MKKKTKTLISFLSNKASLIILSSISAFILLSSNVYAVNPITESIPFKGLMRLLGDISFALMIAAPIICGVLIAVFSGVQAASSEAGDKEKWGKNRKNVILCLATIFSASTLCKIISLYFSETAAFIISRGVF